MAKGVVILLIILLTGVTGALIGTATCNRNALNACKESINCPYHMTNKSSLNFEVIDDLELRAKKAISEVVMSEKDIFSQWQAFDLVSATVLTERMRYFFSLTKDEIAILNFRIQDKAMAGKKAISPSTKKKYGIASQVFTLIIRFKFIVNLIFNRIYKTMAAIFLPSRLAKDQQTT